MTKVRGMDQWIDAGGNLGSAAKGSAIGLEVAGSGLVSCHFFIPFSFNQSINQSIYSFSPMQEVAGIYTDIYYTYWTWYYS